jgi:hypothetical protein
MKELLVRNHFKKVAVFVFQAYSLTDAGYLTSYIILLLLIMLIATLIWHIRKAAKRKRTFETGIKIAHGILEARRIVQSTAICTDCGYANPCSDTYCGRCGAALKAEDSTRVY